MKIRQALKIRNRIVDDNFQYREQTVNRMRKRLWRTHHCDDTDIKFDRLIGAIHDKIGPVQFAGLQFDIAMALSERSSLSG